MISVEQMIETAYLEKKVSLDFCTCHVDDVDDIVGELAAEIRRQVVATGLDDDKLRLEFDREVLDGLKIHRIVL